MTKFKLILLGVFVLTLGNLSVASHHPLDPLSADEIEETVAIIRASKFFTSGNWSFNSINLQEPEKLLLLPFFLTNSNPSFEAIQRRSFTVLLDKPKNKVAEVVVNLRLRIVESWKGLPNGTEPSYSLDEHVECGDIAKSDEAVKARCAEMGWTNMTLVYGNCWGIGYKDDHPVWKNALRPVFVYMFGTMFTEDNFRAHPFDFVVTVDLALRKVLQIDNLPTHSDYDTNNRNGNICPKRIENYDPALLPADFFRTDIHPIKFSQPDGAGYVVKGNEVTWQKFKLRVGFTDREGLILHQVSYQDGDKHRPLFYRMSVGELFVGYGDPRPPYYQKFAFDEGEWRLGVTAFDMKKAGICRGGAVTYISEAVHNDSGKVVPLPNAICIYEEDAGLLWAHQTWEGSVLHTRSQRLVVTSIVNEGSYDYKFSWNFYQDGTIEFTTDLLGAISTQMLAVNVTKPTGFGTIVAPQLSAQYHQHIVALRLDTEIDGNRNTVSTVDVEALPDPTGSERNPYGNGFTLRENILTTAANARTKISPLTGRSWLIKNENRINPITHKPVSWNLVPFVGPPNMLKEDSPMFPRVAYSKYNVWVTRYKEGQIYPAGYYEDGDGLPEWVDQDPDADVTNTDIVLWYVYGFTHIPRAEDWPIMPIEPTGFVMKPMNFFSENPALDVPPPPSSTSKTNH